MAKLLWGKNMRLRIILRDVSVTVGYSPLRSSILTLDRTNQSSLSVPIFHFFLRVSIFSKGDLIRLVENISQILGEPRLVQYAHMWKSTKKNQKTF